MTQAVESILSRYIVRYEDQRDEEDVYEEDVHYAEDAGSAAVLDVQKSFAYMREHDEGMDTLAFNCVNDDDGEPDSDTRYVTDPEGKEWRVVVLNTPIAINLRAPHGRRVSWVHSVGGIELMP
jgi:hypothetical protein